MVFRLLTTLPGGLYFCRTCAGEPLQILHKVKSRTSTFLIRLLSQRLWCYRSPLPSCWSGVAGLIAEDAGRGAGPVLAWHCFESDRYITAFFSSLYLLNVFAAKPLPPKGLKCVIVTGKGRDWEALEIVIIYYCCFYCNKMLIQLNSLRLYCLRCVPQKGWGGDCQWEIGVKTGLRFQGMISEPVRRFCCPTWDQHMIIGKVE